MKTLLSLACLLQCFAYAPAFAAKASALPSQNGAKPVWREWYIFTRNGMPAGYYVEEVARKASAGEVSFTQVITEGGALPPKNTFVNSVASDDDRLSPVSFYVKKRSRETIDIFEGVVTGGEMGVRVHVGAENAVPIASLWKITPTSILGAFVPYYLAKQAALGKIKKGKALAFEALLEEGDEERKFSPTKMTAEATETSIQVGKEKCWEFKLAFGGIPAQWWITENGKLCQMAIPSLGVELRLESEAKAKAFL